MELTGADRPSDSVDGMSSNVDGTNGGARRDLAGARWRKSSRSSGNGGDCVEVADDLPGVVGVRDSKDPDGPVLVFAPSAWRAFVERTKLR